jgi:uncharacterized protein YqfA (UPF0365 family)
MFPNPVVALLVGIIFVGFVLFILFTTFIPMHLWLEARTCGAKVSLLDLFLMRLRGVSPPRVVKPLIMATKSELDLTLKELETHLLSGGDVQVVINSLISAKKAKLPLDFNTATAIDLAGRDVHMAVQMCVTPKVITTQMVENIAKDGIQVKARAKVTVKADINKLVGGAGEETILARVGEGICTRVGSCVSHKEVLENPDSISDAVMSKGLDRQTMFEILSIDIADVDVGQNIGAKLQIDQAEADKQIAQARASQRVANAKATKEEMVAREQEMKAKLIEAQASIPMALAEALRSGNITVMDYHKMKNLEADTTMRESIAHLGPELELSADHKPQSPRQ